MHFDLADVYSALEAKNLAISDPWNEQMLPWKPAAGRRHVTQLGIKNVRFSDKPDKNKIGVNTISAPI